MRSFTATILKFTSKGEKSGWTYVDIPADVIRSFKLKNNKAFRVKGFFDTIKFERLSTYPVGEGNFILAINAEIRKKIGKKEGAMLSVKIALDDNSAEVSTDLLEALKEDRLAEEQFFGQPKSHQTYFHNYINSAKGTDTRAGRIVNTLNAMYRKQNFGEMIRSLKGKGL